MAAGAERAPTLTPEDLPNMELTSAPPMASPWADSDQDEGLTFSREHPSGPNSPDHFPSGKPLPQSALLQLSPC